MEVFLNVFVKEIEKIHSIWNLKLVSAIFYQIFVFLLVLEEKIKLTF